MTQGESKTSRDYMNALRLALPGSRWIKIHGHAEQESGISDILGCVDGHFIAIEMKMPGNEASPLQNQFLREITAAGGYGLIHTHDSRLKVAPQVALITQSITRYIRRSHA